MRNHFSVKKYDITSTARDGFRRIAARRPLAFPSSSAYSLLLLLRDRRSDLLGISFSSSSSFQSAQLLQLPLHDASIHAWQQKVLHLHSTAVVATAAMGTIAKLECGCHYYCRAPHLT